MVEKGRDEVGIYREMEHWLVLCLWWRACSKGSRGSAPTVGMTKQIESERGEKKKIRERVCNKSQN